MAMAICDPANTGPGYKSDNKDGYDDDENKENDENDENDKKDENDENDKKDENDENDENDKNDDDKKAVTCWESYFGGEHPWKKSFDESFSKKLVLTMIAAKSGQQQPTRRLTMQRCYCLPLPSATHSTHHISVCRC